MDRFKVTVNTETFGEANKALEETVEEVKNFAVEKMENFVETVEIKDIAGFEVSVKTEAMEGANEHIEDMSGFKVKVVETLEDEKETVKLRLRRETFENSAILNRVGERPFLLELLVIVQVLTLMMFVKIL